jgi:hypothetical protein
MKLKSLDPDSPQMNTGELCAVCCHVNGLSNVAERIVRQIMSLNTMYILLFYFVNHAYTTMKKLKHVK